MAVDQSALQNFIQKTAGTQTTAQGNVSTIANNGNPNTVYNIAPLPTPTWGTYVPTTTPGQNGAPPTTTFDLVTAPYQPSQPGYDSPFAADPAVAAVLAGMPQATGNPLISNMLNRMRTPRPSTPNPGGPGGPGGPGTTPPGTTPPPTGAPPLPGVPAFPRPIGPISGPIHEWVRSPRTGRPPNATAPTNPFDSGVGRTYALDWLRQNNGGKFYSLGLWVNRVGGWDSPAAQPTNENGTGWWDRVQNYVGGILDGFRDADGSVSWLQVADAITEGVVGGDWYNPETGQFNNPLEASGLQRVLDWITSKDPDAEVTPEQIAELEANISDSQGRLIQDQSRRANELIQRVIDSQNGAGLTEEEIAAYFPDADREWTQDQWRRMQESMQWNNFWLGNDQASGYNSQWGTRQPRLGVGLAGDNMDVFLRGMHNRAQGIHDWFQQMRGRSIR
jgi:hypothetical protein